MNSQTKKVFTSKLMSPTIRENIHSAQKYEPFSAVHHLGPFCVNSCENISQ